VARSSSNRDRLWCCKASRWPVSELGTRSLGDFVYDPVPLSVRRAPIASSHHRHTISNTKITRSIQALEKVQWILKYYYIRQSRYLVLIIGFWIIYRLRAARESQKNGRLESRYLFSSIELPRSDGMLLWYFPSRSLRKLVRAKCSHEIIVR